MSFHLVEAIFLCGIISITMIHWLWFEANWKTGPWFHAAFAALYGVPLIWVGWIQQQSWLLLFTLCLERFVFYNPSLNLFRHEPFFYLSVNSKNPSWWDILELKWKGAYPFVWGASVVGFIIIQFFA